MKHTERTLCVLLCLTLLLSLLAACGGSQTSQESAAPASAASETVEEPAEAAPAEEQPAAEAEPQAEEPPAEDSAEEPEEEPVDLTVELPITTDDVHFSYFVSFPPPITEFYEHPFQDYESWVELRERTGVTIDFLPFSVIVETEQFNLLLASGDYPDVFGSGLLTNSMDYYYEEGVVQDIRDAVQEYMPNYLYAMDEYPEFAESVGIESDEGRWLLLHSYTKNTAYNGGLVIRQDWLDQLGAPRPETIDEYHDILTRFKNELGAGSPMFLNGEGMLVNDAFASAFGVKSFYNNRGVVEYPIFQVDGEIKYGPAEDAYRDYLQTMADWYAEGLIFNDFYSYTDSNTNAPNDLILNDQMGVFTTQLMNMNQYNDQMSIELAGAVTPTLEKGEKIHFDWREAGASTRGLCISTKVEEDVLPVILKMWDYTMSQEGQLFCNWGVEGMTFEYDENGDPYFTDLVTNSPMPAFSIALNVYTLGGSAVSVIDKSREFCNYQDNQMEAMEVWNSNVDGAYDLPDLMTLNAEESEAFASGFSDIITYVSSFNLQVITGQTVLDDAAWEKYLDDLDAMGLKDCLAQYQSAYDRYLEKTA